MVNTILSSRKVKTFFEVCNGTQGEGIETTDGAFGGGGYDSKQRPDMSNTQFLVEALKKAGVAEEDPAMQKVLVFVSRGRTWNHRTTSFRLPEKSTMAVSSTPRRRVANPKLGEVCKTVDTNRMAASRMPD